MLEVEVKLSAMPLCGRNRVLYKEIHIEALWSAFCNIFYNIYGEICGIPENIPRLTEKCLSYS